MIRLLRRTFLLSGVLLCIVYGLLTRAEREKPMPIALLDVSDSNLEHTLYSYVPTTDQPEFMTGRLSDVKTFGVSPNGLWAYVYVAPHFEIGWPYAGLYKVRLDGEIYQPLAEGMALREARWTSDRQSLIYAGSDRATGQSFVAWLNVTSDERQILIGTFSVPLVASPDERWLAYSIRHGSLDGVDKADIFLTDLASGQLQNITSSLDGHAGVILWTTGDEWLIFVRTGLAEGSPSELDAIRPDGSDVQRVTSPSDFATFHGVIGWMDTAQLLVVEYGEYFVSGLHIGQTTPIWTIQGFPAITPDKRTLVYQDLQDRYTLWQMPIEGGTPQKIATLPPMEFGLQISPDGKWVLLAVDADGLYQRQLLRVNLSDGTVKPLSTLRPPTEQDFSWSTDSQWIAAFGGNNGSYWSDILYVMRADGSERRAMPFSQGRPAVSWFEAEPAAPIDRRVGVIGVGLIMSALVGGVVGRQITRVKTRMSANRQGDIKQ